MKLLKNKSTEEIKRELSILRRQERINEARDSMLAFARFMMPDTEDPDDPDKTEYQETAAARCLCQLIEQIELGEKRRVAVSMPPQHGKTIHLSLYAVAWIWGRNPRARFIVTSYNQDRAGELGLALKQLLESPQYQQVFPEIKMDARVQSRSLIENTKGGKATFSGTGGSITGKPADYFFIDDPIKGEADGSDVTPEALKQLWDWFFKVAFSRGSNKTRMLITHTRWSEDDLIGRLCDPSHPEREKEYRGIAKNWFYLNLPGVVRDPDLAKLLGLTLEVPTDEDVLEMFGAEPVSALWPEDKSLLFFAEWKRANPLTFSSLVMGSPSPDDGSYFLTPYLLEYNSVEELPKQLRKYGASDHAVTTKTHRDFNVIGCVGIDPKGDIWVLPDVVIERMETDRIVEEIISQIKIHKPVLWWAEEENIKKAFGPFLKLRMHEEKQYTLIDGIVPSKDLRTRARSIQGRMAMKKVHFPKFAHWWPEARAQLLRFPAASHDDFVAWLALVGLGLLKEIAAEAPDLEESDNVIRVGSIEWILAQTKRQAEQAQRKAVGGW